MTIALIVLATLVATTVGYVVFPRDPALPRPPVHTPTTAAALTARRFETSLAGVLQRLNTINISQRKRLGAAKSARAQATAGRALASAFRDAAASIDRLTPAAAQRPAAALVVEKLTLTSRVYDQLSAAAVAGNRSRYEARRSAVGAREDALRRAIARVYAR